MPRPAVSVPRLSIAVQFRVWKLACLDGFHVRSDGAINTICAAHEIPHETGRLSSRRAEHVVQNEYLAGRPWTGADADGDKVRDLVLNLGGDGRGNQLQHQHRCSGFGQFSRVPPQQLSRTLGPSLYPVSAQ